MEHTAKNYLVLIIKDKQVFYQKEFQLRKKLKAYLEHTLIFLNIKSMNQHHKILIINNILLDNFDLDKYHSKDNFYQNKNNKNLKIILQMKINSQIQEIQHNKNNL